jgi:TRAP-type mannitol/chloroaromatic compound transport system permease large subunit
MVLGFFIDFVEISYIVVPILAPIAANLGIDPIWYAILVAMNLQTSFLTPPFGFSLFYLKGVAPPEVRTTDIYYGVLPFIVLQVLVLGVLVVYPEVFGFNSVG